MLEDKMRAVGTAEEDDTAAVDGDDEQDLSISDTDLSSCSTDSASVYYSARSSFSFQVR